MKLAISNIAWDRDEESEILALLPRFAVQGIEVAPTKVWNLRAGVPDSDVAASVRAWREHGLDVVAFQALLFGRPELAVFGEPPIREETFAALLEVMRLAARAGARVLVFGSPRNRLAGDLPPARALDIAVEFFRRVGRSASELGVCFCIEPNPTEYGCDFVRTAAEGRELVGRVGEPGFRLHLDASALVLNGENYEEEIERSFELLEHFHVSEPHLRVVGESGADHRRIARQLRKLGYRNWISIEMRSQRTPNRPAVESALGFVREVYLT